MATMSNATSIEALNIELAAARAAREEEQGAGREERRRAEERLQEERRRAEERLSATLLTTQQRLEAADQRVLEVERRLLHQHRQQGHTGLTGITAVELAFHFLPTPADVLRAATACRRWRDLACADSVWRARFERDGLADKACLFEVAVPAVSAAEGGAGGGGGGRGSSSGGGAAERDELAGVGLAFYAQVFALKVGNGA